MGKINIGDLVATYLTNTSEFESLLQWGLVLDINSVGDLMVLDQLGHAEWYPRKRWRLLKKKIDTQT